MAVEFVYIKKILEVLNQMKYYKNIIVKILNNYTHYLNQLDKN